MSNGETKIQVGTWLYTQKKGVKSLHRVTELLPDGKIVTPKYLLTGGLMIIYPERKSSYDPDPRPVDGPWAAYVADEAMQLEIRMANYRRQLAKYVDWSSVSDEQILSIIKILKVDNMPESP